jgi:hypothetical protein
MVPAPVAIITMFERVADVRGFIYRGLAGPAVRIEAGEIYDPETHSVPDGYH